MKEPFKLYKYMVLESDLAWIDRNKTTPKKYRYIKQDLFKRLITDYYALHSKYSTREILEYYNLDFVLEAYFRAILKIKGKGMLKNMEDFSRIPRWDALAKYFAQHCISRFKCVS